MTWLLETETVQEGLVLRNAPPTWVIALVIVPCILAFTILFYRIGRQGVPGLVRHGLTFLRIAVLVFVALLLMDPAIQTTVKERKPTLTVVLVDVSASMDHRDDYITNPTLADQLRTSAELPPGTPIETFSRLELVKRILADEDVPFLKKLSDQNRLRLYSFGERLQGIAGLADLEATDRVTTLGRSLERILDEPEVKSSTVGGIVLITDGRNTAGPSPEEVVEVAERRKIPVHCIGVGDPRALKDIELVTVLHSSVVLVRDTVTLDLKVRHRGFPEQQITLQLLENGSVIHRQRVRLKPTEDDQAFRMLYRPMTEGRKRWTVRVQPLPGEHTDDNNSRVIEVLVKDAKIKILYVDSYPRWEYRTLKDFLTRSPETFLAQCLLLEADVGFPQEVTQGQPPLQEFPNTRQQLFYYDVILFGDVDPMSDKFSGGDPDRAHELLGWIKEFVEQGGGFGMIAGDRFSPRAYKDTPLADIIPIVIDPSEPESGGDELGFKCKLTPIGVNHPITRIDDDPKDPERNRRLWEDRNEPDGLKEMHWFSRVKKGKPGAMVLAVHESARNLHGQYPVLVSSTYGEGPVFFTAMDATWRWYWWQGPFSHHRYWGNVVRHLARARLFHGDKRFHLIANRTKYQQGDQITLTAFVKDKTFRPATKDEQEVQLEYPESSGRRETLRLRKIKDGVFEHSFHGTITGDYHAWIQPEDALSDERVSPVSFRVTVSDVERREPILDEPTLKLLSNQTGGTYVTLPKAKDLLSEVATGTVEIPRQRRFLHLRDDKSDWLRWLPVIFLALLSVEWMVRKRFRYL
ncbi:MAG: hypothetical protein CMJ83_00885 [Planctomycetes bacterium]|nr:hypothetical protein [Planctomycetota bacterium]